MKSLLLSLALAGASMSALAAPINYTNLYDGQASGQVAPGTVNSDTSAAHYFRFYTDGLGTVSITGERLDYDYDMSFWLFNGLFADTNAFGASFEASDAGFIAFRDDEIGHPGPYGDPFYSGSLAAGWYTVAVTNFASGGNTGGNGVFDFNLYVTNVQTPPAEDVPEPATLGLLGLGAAALGLARRRRA